MNLLRTVVATILILGLFACGAEEEKTQVKESESHVGHNHSHDSSPASTSDEIFKGHGIGFTIPKGWKKTEMPIPEAGVLVMVEKQGEDESGQFMVSVLDGDQVALNNYMDVMRDEILKNLNSQGASSNFSDVRKAQYNNIDVLVCEYTHGSGGLDFSGSLKTFYCNGKTIYLFTQSEKEDHPKNKAGIEMLERTFACG